jgi:Ca-activated chloride channel family protein
LTEWAALADFHFLRPWWLLALVPGLITFFVVKARAHSQSTWQRIIAPHLLNNLLEKKMRFGLLHPLTFFMLVNILTTVAMAGPSWQRELSPFVADTTPLIILFDVSTSMNTRDVKPSRMIRAKQKMEDLMALRASSPTALIAYSGTAHRVIPLTDDSNVIIMLAQSLNTQMMPVPGKFLERSIALIGSTMKERGNVLVVTDGLGANSLNLFGDYCATSSHHFLFYSMGGDSVPLSDTPADNKILKKLAILCNGYFQSITPDKNDVERLDRELQRRFSAGEEDERPWLDAGYYLLYPLAFFSLFWFRSGWTLNWVLLLVFLSPGLFNNELHADSVTPKLDIESEQLMNNSWSIDRSLERLKFIEIAFLDLWMSKDQQGQFYVSRGNYRKAAQAFRDPMRKGSAFYLAEEFDTAAHVFSRIDSVEGLFNRANALAHGRRYVAAVKTYGIVIARQPNHSAALKNKAHIQKIIDEVNRMSEAQQPEQGESSKELGDAPKTGEGADKLNFEAKEVTQYDASDILNNRVLNDLWMRQVEPDPANFLRSKFLMQQERESSL